MNKLVGVLIRFHQEHVGLMADIEGMCHQVKVLTYNMTRFVFFGGGMVIHHRAPWNTGGLPTSLEGYGLPVVQILHLERCATDNKECYDEETINTINHNFYIDDCLKSMPSDASAIRLVKQLGDLLGHEGSALLSGSTTPEED
jgi:hypothetical protein